MRDTSEKSVAPFLVGTAGWNMPKISKFGFDGERCSGTQLERYAQKFSAVEINSSFYRPHKRATYERWAATTPDTFRFSVKVPRVITHTSRLEKTEILCQEFVEQATGLGPRLGCLLVQLPPSLALNIEIADGFFHTMRTTWRDGPIAIEPRHSSWFTSQGEALLTNWRVARVLADPVRSASGVSPGGWPELIYCRLHGSPKQYYSSYDASFILALADSLSSASSEGKSIWCIFDNTASGVAADNALDLQKALNAFE